MIFKDFSDLVNQVNHGLTPQFCNTFQADRKDLTGAGRVAAWNTLFGNIHSDWAINKGGGTELQYHIYFRGTDVGYGLGFNTQYVQFKNQKPPVEYMRPFMQAYLRNESKITGLLPDYQFIHGDRGLLVNPRHDDYVLLGRRIGIIKNGNGFEIPDADFQEMLSDLRGRQFDAYKTIFQKAMQLTQSDETMDKMLPLLERRRQIILQGAPGTGKTRKALDAAFELIFDKPISVDNREGDLKDLEASGRATVIQFHPAYSYEDFVRGITTQVVGGAVQYEVENKTLARIASLAHEDADKKKYVLIIDEINRANLPSVLGELIYALEYRGRPVEGVYRINGNSRLVLPDNLYIIGTMNTADRSAGNVDYAIRRRFPFVTLKSDKAVIENQSTDVKDVAGDVYSKVEKLFDEHLSPDFKKDDVMIGHSYFLAEDTDEFESKLSYEIKPLLYEYIKDGILVDGSDMVDAL